MKRMTKWYQVAETIKDSIETNMNEEFFVCPYCEEPIYADDYPEIETLGTADKPEYMCPVCGFELM